MMPASLFQWNELRIDVAGMQVPILSIFQALGFSLLLIYISLFSRIRLGKPALISILIIFAGAVWGWVNAATDFKHWMVDIHTFYALIAGILVIRIQSSFRDNWRFIRRLVILSIMMAALNLIGQAVGFVPRANIEGRFTSGYFYTTTSVMLFFLPITAVMAFRRNLDKKNLLLFLSVNTIIIISILLSATRSMLVIYAITMLLTIPFLFRYSQRYPGLSLGILSIAFIGLLSVLIFSQKGSLIATRLGEFENWEEDVSLMKRVEELGYMLAQVDSSNARIFGLGIGSTFYNPTFPGYSDFYRYSLSPHIAILTPYLKFGIVGMGLFVIIPFLWLLRSYTVSLCKTRLRLGYQQCLIAACVVSLLAYIVKTSISGGWSPYDFFIVGIAIGLIAKFRLPKRYYQFRIRSGDDLLDLPASVRSGADK